MVYLDLVMGLNFAVDLLLLLAANRLAGFPARLSRFLAAAALGGIYGGVCLLPGFRFLGKGLWPLVALGAMAVISFGTDKSALRRGTLFALLSMALGGIALGLGRGGNWQLIAAAAGLCCLCLLGFGGTPPHQQYITVEIYHRGRRTALTALRDTGNTLRDPISGAPVLIVDPEAARELLDLEPHLLSDSITALTAAPGLRLVPYRAVGRPAGMLLAFRPDRVTIAGEISHAIVAFAPEPIGNEGYQALAGGSL